jgi:hypothetical protein
MQKRHSGIGTDTLEQRLNIIYPGMYTLDRFVEDDVYIAHLKINLTEQNAKVPIAG